jgi:hypothetical protein
MNTLIVFFYTSLFILFAFPLLALEGDTVQSYPGNEYNWNTATTDDLSSLSDADIINAISNNQLPLDKADEFFTQKGIDSKPEVFNEFTKKKFDIEVTPQDGDTYQDGILTTKDKSTVDLNQLEKGTKIESTNEGLKLYKDGKQINLNNAQNIRQENELLKIDSSSSFMVDQTFTANAHGISYDGSTLAIESADSVIIDSSNILTEVKKLNLNLKSFKIAKADTVRIGTDNGYIYIENVTNSTFRNNGVVEITTDGNINYTIEDLAGNEVNFNAEIHGKVILTKDTTLPAYFIEKSTIKILNETLATNSTASVSIDPNFGFISLILGPGSYYQNDEYGFMVIEPMDGVNYSLGLNKFQGLNFSDACVHCGLIDFVNFDNILKGRIIFKKRVSTDYWLNLFDNMMSKLRFSGLRFMESVSIERVQGSDIDAFISPTNYYILKEDKGYGYLNKYALFLDNRSNSMIGSYNTTIEIENNILNISNRIRVYPKNSIPFEVFLYG